MGAKCLSGDQTVEFVVGRTALFPCRATGIPPPTTDWQRNGLSVAGQLRFRSNQTGFLSISDVREDDGGVYACKAENAGGQVTCRTRLVILGQ